MPDEDFDLFLSLLSKFLRLDSAQKSAIADELRDHLEERLGDLEAQGLPRKEAVRQALEEFGDAAGLASQFTSLSKRRRRKILMRSALATGVVAALAFLAILLIGPGDSDGPPNQLAAQAPEQPKTQPKGIEPKAVVIPLPEVLLKPVDVEFLDTPLQDVASFLGDQVKMAVFLDEKALTEEGVALAEPINLSSAKTPLYLVLNRILHPMKLQWYYENKMLFITTRIAAEEIQVTRYYPVKSLLDAGYDETHIVDLVQSMTGRFWVDSDGTGGELMFVGRMLAVRHSYPDHREVAQLLDALQEPNPFMLRLEPKEHAQLRKALELPVKVEFIDTPLADAAAFLSDSTGVPVVLDEAALKEQGISVDAPIVLFLEGQSLETTLRLILRPLNAEAILRDGTILITTESVAEYDDLSTVIYNVKDIADSESAMKQLEQAIYVATPGPWSHRDGTGGDTSTHPPGTLIIRQNEKNHQEIEKLLQHQRRESDRDVKIKPLPAKPETRRYSMDADTAADLLTSLPEFVAPETWKGENSKGEGTIRKVANGRIFVKHPVPAADQKKKPEQKESEKPPAPETTEPHVVVVPQAVLIIRQSREVHQQIEQFLSYVLQKDFYGYGSGE